MKTCTKCRTLKPIGDFYPARGYADGHYTWCKSCQSEVSAAWHAKNKAKESLRSKRWSEQNIERRREIRRNWQRKHRAERTAEQRIHDNIRAKICEQLKGTKNRRTTFVLLGYNPRDLMVHLQSQFKDGMSWDNYGKWHIDHIKPRSHFSISSTEDAAFRECWALTNLQPLWASENCSKQDRVAA
jgi:hypothetical protein